MADVLTAVILISAVIYYFLLPSAEKAIDLKLKYDREKQPKEEDPE